MKLFHLLLIPALAFSISSCNGDDDDVLDPVKDPVTEELESYLIINGDSVPNTTQSINVSDTVRTIFQTNFKNEEYFVAVSYSVSDPIEETKDYTTSNDRAFYYKENTEDSINLYITDFNNDLNYISEKGKTLSVVKNQDDSHTISISNLSAVEESEGNTSITVSLKVKVSF